MIKNNNEITITEDESKICEICEKVFGSGRLKAWHVRKEHKLDFKSYILHTYYNNIVPKCLKTGVELTFKAHQLGPWYSNFSKNNFPRKPHTQESKDKIRDGCEKTSMEKFGVKNVFSTDWCKDKIKSTMNEKYGVNNIMELDKYKLLFSTFKRTPESFIHAKETSMLRFNKEHYSYTDKHLLNIRIAGYNRFYKNWDDYLSKLLLNKNIKCNSSEAILSANLPMEFECNLCNNIWASEFMLMPECPKCLAGFRNCRSKVEASLLMWLTENIKEPVISNKRFNINGKVYEADAYIKDLNTIIELHGVYWHSEQHGQKDRKYHIDKFNALKSLGFNIIQIFEDEWLLKSDIVKSKLLHKLKYGNSETIYARKCKVKIIDNVTANELVEKSHIQGKSNAQICYGAYYNDELVSVMTFSKPRINMGNKTTTGIYEIVRFSSILNKRIVGIASRLFNRFIADYNPDKIISYADLRWTLENDNLYTKMGMKFEYITKPNYWYVKKLKREYRYKYTKHILISKYNADPTLTEWEIMKSMGYDRIWDCGNLKYVWTNPIEGNKLEPIIKLS